MKSRIAKAPLAKYSYPPKARPRIQRTFLQWFAESHSRFATPLRIKRRTDHGIELTFPRLTPDLRPYLNGYGIVVLVDWEGKSWDLIGVFECAVRRTGDTYISAMCRPEYRKKYPSRESLWINEIFEPFLEWCNKKLAPARWLALNQIDDGGITWAKLLVDDTDSEEAYTYARLPVHLP